MSLISLDIVSTETILICYTPKSFTTQWHTSNSMLLQTSAIAPSHH